MKLSCGEVKEITVQAANGLRGVHAKNIIHADFDYRNVFVGYKSKKLDVKVGDFGLSKEADRNGKLILPHPPTSYSTAVRYGRRVYGITVPEDNAAFEVLENTENYSFASDVHSFGYFLLQILYGEESV